MKYGFSLGYASDRDITRTHQKTYPKDKINKVAGQIRRNWVLGREDSAKNVGSEYYFTDGGNLAYIVRRRTEKKKQDRFIDFIQFINTTLEGLEKTTLKFDLPFDKKEVNQWPFWI